MDIPECCLAELKSVLQAIGGVLGVFLVALSVVLGLGPAEGGGLVPPWSPGVLGIGFVVYAVTGFSGMEQERPGAAVGRR